MGDVIRVPFGLALELAASVEKQPEVTIYEWRIAHTNAGTCHVVGMETEEYGRCSTPIEAYDPATKTAITRSGRIYNLAGPGGRNEIAEDVWAMSLKFSGLTEVQAS